MEMGMSADEQDLTKHNGYISLSESIRFGEIWLEHHNGLIKREGENMKKGKIIMALLFIFVSMKNKISIFITNKKISN